MRKGLEFAPQQIKARYPIHSWVDWWEADGKKGGKLLGLELRTSGSEPRTQPLHHTASAQEYMSGTTQHT